MRQFLRAPKNRAQARTVLLTLVMGFAGGLLGFGVQHHLTPVIVCSTAIGVLASATRWLEYDF